MKVFFWHLLPQSLCKTASQPFPSGPSFPPLPLLAFSLGHMHGPVSPTTNPSSHLCPLTRLGAVQSLLFQHRIFKHLINSCLTFSLSISCLALCNTDGFSSHSMTASQWLPPKTSFSLPIVTPSGNGLLTAVSVDSLDAQNTPSLSLSFSISTQMLEFWLYDALTQGAPADAHFLSFFPQHLCPCLEWVLPPC